MAMLNQEPGQDIGEAYLGDALLSIVNYAEVASNLGRRHLSAAVLRKTLESFDRNVVPMDKETALLTGALTSKTKQHGLSLGDRACLALGIAKNLPVLTADRAWADVELPVEVKLIR